MFREKTSKILKWMNEQEEQIRGFNRDSMPSYIQRRDRDKWESLFAIASVLGEKWLERVQRISLEVKQDDVLTRETTLLKDIQDIYYDWNDYSGEERDNKVANAELSQLFHKWTDEDGYKPFIHYNKGYTEKEKYIRPDQVSKILRSFGLKTESHRSLFDKEDRRRGYLWGLLLDRADRHLPEEFRRPEDVSCRTVASDKVEEGHDGIPF
jgi:hypothetical protein